METKQCRNCSEVKPLTEFSVHQRKANNPLKRGSTMTRHNAKPEEAVVLNPNCKKCCAVKAKEFRQRHKELTGDADYRGSGKSTKYPKEDRALVSAIRQRLQQTKGNAKRKGVVVDLTEEYLYDLYKSQKDLCALSGVELQIEGNSNLRLSLDKIIPEKGYIEGNVQWTIFAVNRAKGDLTQEDFLRLCSLVLERATTIETTS